MEKYEKPSMEVIDVYNEVITASCSPIYTINSGGGCSCDTVNWGGSCGAVQDR